MTDIKPDKCAFCRIISGETAVDKVYEDDRVLAFLHLSALNKGHILAVPKTHYNGPTHMSPEEFGHLMAVASELAAASMRATKSDAYNLLVADGASAGQVVPHLSVEIIPRLVDDGLTFPARTVDFQDQEEKERVIKKIERRMNAIPANAGSN